MADAVWRCGGAVLLRRAQRRGIDGLLCASLCVRDRHERHQDGGPKMVFAAGRRACKRPYSEEAPRQVCARSP